MNLVVGATGSLGSEIVKLLADAGKPARALVRPTSDQKKVNSTPNSRRGDRQRGPQGSTVP